MSITGAMNAAISGLRAAARGSELVSNNISNALTPSYGRRGLDLSALSYGATGGVRIDVDDYDLAAGDVIEVDIVGADAHDLEGRIPED